jgi:hypothetical protein
VDTPATDVGLAADRLTGQPITVTLIPKAVADLDSTCERSKLNRADIVNRAIALYEFLDAERAAGAKLLLRRPDGTVFSVDLI